MAKIRVEEEFSSAASEAESVESGVESMNEGLEDEFENELLFDSDADAEVEGDEEEVEEVTAGPAAKKQKKVFNPDALASAFQSVLRQTLPASAQNIVKSEDSSAEAGQKDTEPTAVVPILSRRKAVERNIEEEQLDYRARQILKAQIRATQDSMHQPIANAPESLNFERSLRKLATRGVVQLFNSIQVNQQQKDEERRVRRQEKLIIAQQNLPTSNLNDLSGSSSVTSESKSGLSSSSNTTTASYFDFLKQQQQKQTTASSS